MLDRPSAVFLINLVQDVNVLRPLIVMASRDFGLATRLLVSSKFAQRDLFGIWAAELDTLKAELKDLSIDTFESPWDAARHLTGRGLIFAGSESSLPGHKETHEVLRIAPASFTTVTLQHGFECVGFRHSPAHDRAHGERVSFAADIVCGWQDGELLSSIPASQRPKLFVTGPTALLQGFEGPVARDAPAPGIICENLHSVRLNVEGGTKMEFVAAFSEFCRLVGKDSKVVLRPHPGGQYSLKNAIQLPANVEIDNAPMYRLDLRRFAFGISAPSSVVLDMVLAGIPTAVWHDKAGSVDTGNYAGLTSVSTPAQWAEFARAATAEPAPFLERQAAFLEAQRMPLDPAEIYERYAALFRSAVPTPSVGRGAFPVAKQRVLFVANAHLPTLQVCLEQPLASAIHSGEVAAEILTETELLARRAELGSDDAFLGWLDRSLVDFAPDAMMFSRYSGPHARHLLDWAKRRAIPTVYQIDDDLLAVPKSLGERKYAYHNAPERLDAVRTLLTGVDLVYASTERLQERLLGYYPDLPIVAGAINCSGRVISRPQQRPARILGYMASADHLPNLEMILPAVIATLDRYPQLRFELFGSIPVPPELERFGDRVVKIPPIAEYDNFLERFAERKWDIGLCPLTPTDFNLTKLINKWVEYTSIGAAVVASRGMIYDECCADGSGMLADGTGEWLAALEQLVADDAARIGQVQRAQAKLETRYGIEQHRRQIMAILDDALGRAMAGRSAEQGLQESS
ncbi:MAG TPA: hypothetical protein VIL42_03955 [Sphingomicrobium sp.]